MKLIHKVITLLLCASMLICSFSSCTGTLQDDTNGIDPDTLTPSDTALDSIDKTQTNNITKESENMNTPEKDNNSTPQTTNDAVSTAMKDPETASVPSVTETVTTDSTTTAPSDTQGEKAPVSTQGEQTTSAPETTTTPNTTSIPETTKAPETTSAPTTETDPEILARTFGGIVFEKEIYTVTKTSGIPYTRMIALEDGRLMMVFGEKRSGDIATQIYAIYSSDNGKTWGSRVPVTKNIDTYDIDGKLLTCANGVPYQLEDGTILVAYRANTKKDSAEIKQTGKYHSSIRIMQSKDGGKNFTRHSIVWDLYEENIPDVYASSVGVWEPHLGMLNSELACFFAIGKSVYNYDHTINSTDIFVYRNGSWVRASYTSTEIPGSVKNGMPVWQKLNGGGYILAVESNKNKTSTYKNVLTTKLLLSTDGIHWTNQCDVYVPDVLKRRSAAPYVVQLPNGQIVVSYMTDEDAATPSETGNDKMIFKISVSKPGKSVYELRGEDDFYSSYNIFNCPVGKESRYGGMYVDDKYLYVYTATNNGSSKIVLRRAALSQFK